MAGATAFWMFVVVGALYSPVAAFAPETLPTAGGAGRAILVVDLWLLVAAVPMLEGALVAMLDGGRGWQVLRQAPLGFVHLAALGCALTLLIPWLLGRRVYLIVTRHGQETYATEVELDAYKSVVTSLADLVAKSGLRITVRDAPFCVRVARLLIDRYGPRPFQSPRPYIIKRITGDGVDLTVYASLIDLAATRDQISRLRAALLGHLPPDGMWWTQSAEGRAIEAAILGRGDTRNVTQIAEILTSAEISSDDWRMLQREYLLAFHSTGGGKPAQ